MTLVLIFGPPTVGKMAVGKVLAEKIGFKLFHNHMTIELLLRIFEHGTPQFQSLDKEFRFRIFTEFAQSSLKGLVFTFVWALDDREDLKYVQDIIHIFTSEQHPIYFVELEAKLEVRLERNKTADRLAEKASKRNLVLYS